MLFSVGKHSNEQTELNCSYHYCYESIFMLNLISKHTRDSETMLCKGFPRHSLTAKFNFTEFFNM